MEKIKWSGSSHKEWLAQRRNIEGHGIVDVVRFGASDIGTITGVSKYKCKRRLFYQAIGLHNTEWRTETSVAGHLQEPVVSAMWESWCDNQEEFLFNLETGVKLRKTKKADFFLLNNKYPNMFCSIDRLHDGQTFSPFTGIEYQELTPIELKTTQSAYYKLWNEGITESYMHQVQSQMMLSETEVAVFCTLVSGFQFHVREVEYNKEIAQLIDHSVREFATLCVAGKQIMELIGDAKSNQEKEEYMAMLHEIEPEALELEDEQSLTREMNPVSAGQLKGTQEDFEYMVEYKKASDEIKALEEVKQLAKNKLTTKMKDAEDIVFDDGSRVTWRRQEGKRDYFTIKVK